MSRPTILCAGFILAYALTCFIAHADTALNTSFVPLADIGGNSSKLADLYSSNSLSDYINKVFTFSIALGAIAAVLRLAYAGYLYMGSSDMWSNKSEARKVIGDVTLGLLLLLAIWLILNQINPDITSLNALKSITPVQQQPSVSSNPSAPLNTSNTIWCTGNGGSCSETQSVCEAARKADAAPCEMFVR